MTIVGTANCAALFDQGIPPAINYATLSAAMTSHGFTMPVAFQFRDHTGKLIATPLVGSLTSAQTAFDQCAANNGGVSSILRLQGDGTPGGFEMAKDVVAQLVAARFFHAENGIVAGG